MKTYFVDCWEQATRFRTVEVQAESEDEAVKIAVDTVDFEGAEWNTDKIDADAVWEDEL